MPFPIRPIVDFDPRRTGHWLLLAFLVAGGLFTIYSAGRIMFVRKARKPPFHNLTALPVQDRIYFFGILGAFFIAGVIAIGVVVATLWAVRGGMS